MAPPDRRIAAPVAVLVLAAALAGCGGDGDIVPPCIGGQRPVSMTPPRLTAMQAGLEGTVEIDYVVERDGHVTGVEVRSTKAAADGDASGGAALPAAVEQAVVEAVETWRFREPLMRCRGRMALGLGISTVATPPQ